MGASDPKTANAAGNKVAAAEGYEPSVFEKAINYMLCRYD
jgi:hypothetical protein